MKDIDEIRRQNIVQIEKEVGSAAILSNLLGMSYAQYVNLRDGAKDSKTGKPRGMRKDTARKFEMAGHKPSGWLDVDHSFKPDMVYVSNGLVTIVEAKEPRPIETSLLEDFCLLLDEDQKRIASEVKRLADIARAYRKKFGAAVVPDEQVAKAIPAAPKHNTIKQ